MFVMLAADLPFPSDNLTKVQKRVHQMLILLINCMALATRGHFGEELQSAVIVVGRPEKLAQRHL